MTHHADGELSLASVRSRHPHFFRAVAADLRMTSLYRGERSRSRSRFGRFVEGLRLCLVSDAFLAQVCYRGKARLQSLRIPVIPRILHRVAMMTSQVCIGDPVVVEPGLYLAHGQVVVDGFVEIGPGVVLFPWVTIGLRAGIVKGPTIEKNVHVGTGAKVIGPITVGAGARIGANAVVLADVAPRTTVVGMPARPVPKE